ncbi:MAG TPA: NADH-ubiquinone oxidoreductase-F iron-sulfur binding region domain-containing protein [Nocardioides sp.]|uniref:NADH-ubiquinone oxidoreductase-F iron-sulfur binding region domain-containing protein n=1 Tax=Nocardioides sp. TaxID=35761 RepID=UPI002D7ED5B0|nr:NADH-ubiquinone oxidoreductase-F iron-sulfur binding region domain-containing protein [Nocardioides sp.]HET6653823.1 NADH-ubiquinone oxidoreductase-F iron-sulfur binding region domain-containing protein [Nocardioides sp.]
MSHTTTRRTPTVEVRPSENYGPLQVHPGPRLLDGISHGPSLAAHRAISGPLPDLDLAGMLGLLEDVNIRGRGGAGFPFTIKLEAAAGAKGRATVVVNASEGEPASMKDAAVALTKPHLILDGAVLTARVLGAKEIHLVLPGEHPAVRRSLTEAVAERERDGTDGRIKWRTHTADQRFVAGQARAVIELMAGRENLPVTSWGPEAHKGYKNRPTLLSNAETYTQVAALAALGGEGYRALGTEDEPGTCLLTVNGDGHRPQVIEVPHGTAWSDVLTDRVLDRPVLVGGYHGTWAAPSGLRDVPVSRSRMTDLGLALGAGVVLPLEPGDCPLHRTARVTAYLAGQSARRCGPCLNGLPALYDAVWAVHRGQDGSERIEQLGALLARRGACAHPDGTLRLVQSMMTAFGEEIALHADGHCSYVERASSHTNRSGDLTGATR